MKSLDIRAKCWMRAGTYCMLAADISIFYKKIPKKIPKKIYDHVC